MANAPEVTAPVTLLAGALNHHPADPQEYARRISSNAKFTVAENSGHWIQLDEPGLIVEAVRELVKPAH
jgi:pimeloyl-ACP methyl ester carboxylesterase